MRDVMPSNGERLSINGGEWNKRGAVGTSRKSDSRQESAPQGYKGRNDPTGRRVRQMAAIFDKLNILISIADFNRRKLKCQSIP